MSNNYIVFSNGFIQTSVQANNPKHAAQIYYDLINRKLNIPYAKFSLEKVSEEFTHNPNIISVRNRNLHKHSCFAVRNSNLFYVANRIENNNVIDASLDERRKLKAIVTSPITISLMEQLYAVLSIGVQKYLVRNDILLHKALLAQNDALYLELAKKGCFMPELLHTKEVVKVLIELAKHGYGLDKLLYNNYAPVREEVAKQGYGLNILCTDSNSSVRRAVARQGYALDSLQYDSNELVQLAAQIALGGQDTNKALHGTSQERVEMATQGLCTDILVKDNSELVRIALAKQGYELDKLVHDECFIVRREIIKRGYKPELFIHDEDYNIRNTAKDLVVTNEKM